MIGAGILASAVGLAFGARRLQSMSSATGGVVKSAKRFASKPSAAPAAPPAAAVKSKPVVPPDFKGMSASQENSLRSALSKIRRAPHVERAK